MLLFFSALKLTSHYCQHNISFLKLNSLSHIPCWPLKNLHCFVVPTKLSRNTSDFERFFFFCLFVCLFFVLKRPKRAVPAARGKFPDLESNQSCSCQPMPQPQQCQIQARLWPTPQLPATLDPLTHWARPGIEPLSSWILVRFVNRWTTMGTPVKFLSKRFYHLSKVHIKQVEI